MQKIETIKLYFTEPTTNSDSMMLTTLCLDTSFMHSAPDKVENKEHMTEEIFTFLIHKSRQYIIWSTSYPHKFDNENAQLFRMYC